MGTIDHKDLYKELFQVVKHCLLNNVDKEQIESIIEKLIEAFINDPQNELILYSYTRSKDNYLMMHITNCVVLTVGFGISLKISKKDLKDLGICSFCHDFGMKEYTHLFQKEQTLGPEEQKFLQEHPSKSVEKFEKIFHEKIIKGILDMHEHVNGHGYPNGKTDMEISYLSKIISICDVFESLTHPRNFRSEFNPYEAMKMLIKKKDIIFDGTLIKKFLKFMSIYPIGSLVQLNTGEIAIVIGSDAETPTRSVVRVLLTAKRDMDTSGKIINLIDDKLLYILGPVPGNDEKEILRVMKPRGEFDL